MINKIKTLPITEYPRIQHQLNRWVFPDELKEFEPKNWELLPVLEKSKIITDARKFIVDIIGEKECLRYLHTKSGDLSEGNKSDIDFEVWYANRKPISQEAINILKEFYLKETKQN